MHGNLGRAAAVKSDGAASPCESVASSPTFFCVSVCLSLIQSSVLSCTLQYTVKTNSQIKPDSTWPLASLRFHLYTSPAVCCSVMMVEALKCGQKQHFTANVIWRAGP
ncbi:hypothetical protein BCV70DRAFT_125472 [Testicularia cyperi]|uniref:Uncharacterized protein n=1 Tax=Testicularia cyperi TaxID=1882483 RepID=A0A317XLF2_9BASI|nr:hypothetical protein BCV70DRAFT_125472 [Testicularia cyperi]